MNNVRKIIIYVFFFGANSFSFSQNWQLVNPLYKYNYCTVNPAVVSATVWVDSIKNNLQPTYYFNRVIGNCDTCISAQLVNDPYDTAYVLSNQPSFLQRKMYLLNNGICNFTDKGNIVIRISDTINSHWVFDSLNNITAQLISRTVQTVFSVTDSIQCIKLSSGDTIVISKNYGILQYPVTYSNNQYYKLTGIEGINKGLQTLKFKDFFNFSNGDVFQYSVNDDNYIFYPPFYKQGIRKIQILNRIQNTDTISYEVKTTLLDSAWLLGNNPVYTYSTNIDTITYIDSANHFTNLYTNQLTPVLVTTQLGFISTPSINQLETNVDTKGLSIKSYGITCPNNSPNGINYGLASSVDTINPNLYLIRNTVLILGREAKVGLGITSDVYNNYDEIKTTCLTGYIKGTDTVGIITPDAQLNSIATNRLETKFDVTIFPNPSHENVSISFSSPYSGQIYLYNNSGQCVFSKDVEEILKYRIETSDLSSGIYLVKFNYRNSFLTKKLIIQ